MQRPIRVRAKTGVLVPVPCQKYMHGGVALYVGRDVNHEAHKSGETDVDVLYPQKKDAEEYSVKVHGHHAFTDIQRALTDGVLLRELKDSPAPMAPIAADPTADALASRKKA